MAAMSRPGSSAWLMVVAASVLWGCGAGGAPASPTLDPARDKLAQVLARGTLILSTDPEYPPQSMLVEGATRPADTACASNQLTAPEVEGYDAETSKLVAEILGVEACFVTPPWNDIIGGNWGDRWDASWGSGALNADRMSRLYVTQPYYSTPQVFFVREDSPVSDPSELSGKRVGACSGCTHELYLAKTLELPGQALEFAVDDAEIVTFSSEPPGLQALADGDVDAFLAGAPVGADAISNGLPLRMLEPPAFFEQQTGYVDRGLRLDAAAFIAAINDAVNRLHADGRLKDLSMRYFGVDYASPAAAFDLASVQQAIP